MPEYITKEQALKALGDALWYSDSPEDIEFYFESQLQLKEIKPADVIERPEMFARLMNEFNAVDIDEDTGECILNDNWVSIIDVIDTLDGMRAEGTESIWGNGARMDGDEQ